jgi:hypothetical protein
MHDGVLELLYGRGPRCDVLKPDAEGVLARASGFEGSSILEHR